MTSVEVRDVSVRFDTVRVLHDVSMHVDSGGWLGLIGPNGAGKSTLLRSIAGLVPFDGTITLGDERVGALNRRKVARLVAFVPQTPFIPRAMTVTDYLLMGRTPYIAYLGTESRADLEVVGRVLADLELENLGSRSLGSLSGGELQRVVLGRALAQEAPILLLDEPTSALDVGHQQQVLELVDSLRSANELTVISAMHDLTLAGQFAGSLLMLDSGRNVASGGAAEVLTEAAITRHYGAHVRVLADPDGGILVVPTRARAGVSTTDASATSADRR
jgi:iron complex transport system ATP-binding protein